MSERPRRTHIYVILRHESWAKTDVAGITPFGVTPTKAYRQRKRAVDEAARLNQQNSHIGAHYWVALARLI